MKNGGNFLEKNIEKIILGLSGIICLWILITRVIMSPNLIQYENKKFSAQNVDLQLKQQTELLEKKINQEPKQGELYKSKITPFISMFNCALSSFDANSSFSQPAVTSTSINGNKVYSIPSIGEVKNIDAEHIRAVAYIPEPNANEQNYDSGASKREDLDIVTIEGKFDVAGLYERFHDSFAGEAIPTEWRDSQLVTPVFAAVELQRQQLMPDGSWSQWQIIPRTKIEQHRKLFQIEEDATKLPPGGVKLLLLQFNNPVFTKELLQPPNYKIATSTDEWFPPSMHRDFIRSIQMLKAQEKHDARMANKEESTRSGSRPKPEARARSGKSTETSTSDAAKKRGESSETAKKPQRKRAEQEKKEVVKPSDFYNKFNSIMLNPSTDFAHMNAMSFWAVDDTVQPGKTYKYRIRLGVFNPIAGSNQFSKDDKKFQNSVILWSDYSEDTKNIEISDTVYFFPKELQEVSNTVTIQISKYRMGTWNSKDFAVKKGEQIGKMSRPEGDKTAETSPDAINFDSGAVLVDIVKIDSSSGDKNLHQDEHFEMLYSYDGKQIERLPIKMKNWNEKLQAKFAEIRKFEKEPKIAFREFGSPVIYALSSSKTASD